MKNKLMFSLVLFCLVLGSPSAFSKEGKENNKGCKLSGDYGYLYNGTSFSIKLAPTPPSPPVPVPLTETGTFTVDTNGDFSGVGTMTFYFSSIGGNPLWLLLHEEQSSGTVTYDENNPCSGSINLLTTVTVTQSSNPAVIPVGYVISNNAPRSVAFTISSQDKKVVDMISTSPGTIASGTAHKQD